MVRRAPCAAPEESARRYVSLASRFGAASTLARSHGARGVSLESRCTSEHVSRRWLTPGEILVTRTVRDLVAGSGIAFEERGEHQLKGVPDPWTLYAVTG